MMTDLNMMEYEEQAIVNDLLLLNAYPFQSIQIIVEVAESLPSVITPVSSSHETLQHQTNINQSDLIIWREVSLQNHQSHAQCSNLLLKMCNFKIAY